jgi:uncharacterized protein (TIGR02145 family)
MKTSSWGGTNDNGFSAFSGGYRYVDGSFGNLGVMGFWWSATAYNSTASWYRYLVNVTTNENRNYCDMRYGYSVRCVKDP